MFEQFYKPKAEPVDQAILQDQRNMEYNTKENLVAGATHPQDDVNYMDLQERRSDLIRWQQELDEDVYKLVLSFLALREDDSGTTKEIKGVKALCNRQFIHQVVEPKLKPFMSKSFVNSCLDETRILGLLERTSNDICDNIADNWDKYAMEFVNWDIVIRDMKNIMEAAAWRSLKGWTKRVDSSMIKRIESEAFGQQMPNQKKGLLGIFGG